MAQAYGPDAAGFRGVAAGQFRRRGGRTACGARPQPCRRVVMEQRFSVAAAVATTLNLAAALSTAMSTGADDGLTVEVLDSTGTAVASQTFVPQERQQPSGAMPVELPGAGIYTLRFTEVDPRATPPFGGQGRAWPRPWARA